MWPSAICFKRLLALCSAVTLCAVAPTVAIADTPIVRLKTALMPETLGASTTVGFGFSIGTDNGTVPSPLVRLRVGFPPGISFLTSTLGVGERCNPTALFERGVRGCPANARIGQGNARVEVAIGHARMSEAAAITVLTGEPNPNYVEGLFFEEGWAPVTARLVFPMAMHLESGPVGIQLDTAIPLIPTWPTGPVMSIVDFGAEIGPRHLTYYKEVNGRTVAYRPTGLVLPKRCPSDGFRFSASFVFQDGSHVSKPESTDLR